MNTTLKRDNLFLAMLLATLLSAGAWVAWMILCAVTALVIAQALSDPHSRATLTLTVDGEPLLQSWATPGYIKRVIRTLAGRLIEDADSYVEQTMYRDELAGPHERLVDPVPWNYRIRGFLRSQPSPVFWYLMRPAQATGGAYFVGYDPVSRRLIGYLGLKGFASDIPAVDEQFVMSHLSTVGGEFAPNSNSTFGTEPITQPRDGSEALFVISNGSLYRIDFRRQAVRSVKLPAQVISVGTVDEPILVADDRRAISKHRVAARMEDHVAVLDFDGQILTSVTIPPELRDVSFALYDTVGDEWMAVQNQSGSWQLPTDIYWFDVEGKITRREQVDLSPGLKNDPRKQAWSTATVFPMPLPLAIGGYIFRPLSDWSESYVLASRANHAERPDFRTALAQSVADSWLPFLLVCLVSAAAAIVCHRHQRRVGAEHAMVWALFVFLMGLPGLIGYWIHRKWPPRERCTACGDNSPRDRQQCLACAVEFPPPVLLGSEILA
jgi:hypothetical protein